MSGFLLKVMDEKRAEMQAVTPAARAELAARALAAKAQAGRMHAALSADGINIIAEFKRSSPSAGAIRAGAQPVEVARLYEQAGAAAMSVLTEPKYFSGSLDDLRAVHAAVELPLLRKDFTVDSYQLHEAVLAGASAALLIVAGLSDDELATLLGECARVGLDALVEVHSEEELQRAAHAGARIIGVNNRNLQTLEVTLETSMRLAELAPKDAVLISESGIRTAGDIRRLRGAGYRGFLIGETLMRAEEPARMLRELRSACAEDVAEAQA